MAHDSEAAAVAAIVQSVDAVDLQVLMDLLGVNDLIWLDGAQDQTVTLPERSSLGCPAHDITLKPDACRSCAFLAGGG
jgi:hypothetical protein